MKHKKNLFLFPFLFACFLCGMLHPVEASSSPNIVIPNIHLEMHRQLRDRQDESLSFHAYHDSLLHVNDVKEEVFELYPSLNLYRDWDDAHVDPLRGKTGIAIPDTMDIDISGFCAPCYGRITSSYGWRKRRMHKGTDIKVYTGDTIRAAFSGRVRIRKYDRRGYGYYLVLRHNNGLETVYGHLSRFLVAQDDLVKAGEPIALGGNTGRSTGSHLHFETRFMGIAIDPAAMIDFSNFKPKSSVYKFRSKHAKLAQEGLAAPSGGALYHRVKSGDTLGRIAKRYGTTVSRLCRLNNIRSTKTLRIGQRIRYR